MKTKKDLQEQNKNSKYDHLKPWQFKPGQSGNPAGRPPGTSLKEYAKKYLAGMTDEERNDFLSGISKDKIWEMAEGKAKQETEHSGTLTIGEVLDDLDDGPETEE